MMLSNRKREISVIITCCGRYHQYLPTALDSVQRQTIPPDEILIVYDNTKPSITSVPHIETAYSNPYLARKAGFEATHKEVLFFLDADDYISDDYIAAGLSVKSDNNIVYCDVQQFGDVDRRLYYHPKFLSQENYFAVASLVSRTSIEISRVFDLLPPLNCHEDWVFWRKLVRAGCPTSKQHGIHYHREHILNRSKTIDDQPFYIAKGVCCDQVDVVFVDPADTVAINNAIRTSAAEYIIFARRGQSIDIHNMLRQLRRGAVLIQDKTQSLWAHTLAVVDILQSQLPFLEPQGQRILI